MADIKISALPGASTLTGAETIPLVQGGTTKKVTTDQFLIKDGSGNVGVGTASTDARLTVEDAYAVISARSTTGSKRVAMGSDAFTDAFVGSTSAHNLSLIAGGNVGAVLTTSGNLGLGVTPSAWNNDYKAQQLGSTAAIYGRAAVKQTGISDNAFRNSSGSWIYTTTASAQRYELDSGMFAWYTAPSGTAGNPISFTQAMTLNASGVLTLTPTTSQAALFDYSGGAYTTWQHSGTSLGDIGAANQVIGGGSSADFAISSRSGSLVLGTANGVERARIDASGNLLVGTTSAFGRFTVRQDSDAESPIYVVNAATSGKFASFEGNGAVRGSITWSGSTTSFNTSSDARLKENISNADNGSALIDGLQVRKFDWKSDGSHQRFGFVAQELDAVYPEAVSKPADPDEMMGVDYSKLVPLLVQEIQSLRARVAALETV